MRLCRGSWNIDEPRGQVGQLRLGSLRVGGCRYRAWSRQSRDSSRSKSRLRLPQARPHVRGRIDVAGATACDAAVAGGRLDQRSDRHDERQARHRDGRGRGCGGRRGTGSRHGLRGRRRCWLTLRRWSVPGSRSVRLRQTCPVRRRGSNRRRLNHICPKRSRGLRQRHGLVPHGAGDDEDAVGAPVGQLRQGHVAVHAFHQRGCEGKAQARALAGIGGRAELAAGDAGTSTSARRQCR